MPYLTDMYHDQNATTQRTNNVAVKSSAVFDHDAFVARLGQRIIGQPKAVSAAARALSIAHAGVADPGRPLASVLLVGPTGVGKTELVRQIAAEIRTGPDDLCRIDMAALAQEHYAASFSGAPPGYAGSKESFTLFDKNKIEGDPYTPGIVLFDEVEKADRTVIRALLHVLDSGELRLANGRDRISFRNSYVFMTSNLGSKDVAAAQRTSRWSPRWRRLRVFAASPTDPVARAHGLVSAAVEEFFDPEFLNRIDETVVMAPFDASTARKVTVREVGLFSARLAREHVELRVDYPVMEFLQDCGFDPIYGARGLRRTIRSHLVAPVAECVLRARTTPTTPIVVEATVIDHAVAVRLLDEK
ncbi:ATP-dependent Clp protease ATP-binding subunit [Mycobacterium manitobense]|uniref:ATP-dependent Clp protease ATP-binding subunit n=1 Tax=[Mycobacterium] manitobense TaxID=190147 RepID=A0A9X2YNL4_9MYCO|nr:AAA family ATPase [[Mycobacterium] manitobense]MCV7170434.1 ATP-dependent Clp protease ATP-binding subunit [[Mycobacterium] manitobense]